MSVVGRQLLKPGFLQGQIYSSINLGPFLAPRARDCFRRPYNRGHSLGTYSEFECVPAPLSGHTKRQREQCYKLILCPFGQAANNPVPPQNGHNLVEVRPLCAAGECYTDRHEDLFAFKPEILANFLQQCPGFVFSNPG